MELVISSFLVVGNVVVVGVGIGVGSVGSGFS